MKRAKLTVRLLRHSETARLDRFLAIYAQSFNPDERVSPAILREVAKPSPDRPNRVQLFAAFEGRTMVGGAVMLLLPAFGVVFGSYIFVDPAMRGTGRGSRILREVIRQEKQGPGDAEGRLRDGTVPESHAMSGTATGALAHCRNSRYYCPSGKSRYSD